jgi:hypothetical protein
MYLTNAHVPLVIYEYQQKRANDLTSGIKPTVDSEADNPQTHLQLRVALCLVEDRYLAKLSTVTCFAR